MKHAGRVPIISPWLYRISVRSYAARARAGDIPAVRDLAGTFCTSPDPKARDLAAQGLKDLPLPEQCDLLCREALLRDCPSLVTLVHEYRYRPSSAEENALFLFCTSLTGELHLLDPDHHQPLLARGYRAAPACIRARARAAARAPETGCLLARALMGRYITDHAKGWNFDEWEIIITTLIAEMRWNDLWILAVLAPLPHAVNAVTALKNSGWTPDGEDSLLWKAITASSVERWAYPVPKIEEYPSADKPSGQVSRLTFSPDGSLLVTGSFNGIISIRSTRSAALTAEFGGCEGPVRFLAVTADNSCVVYGGEEGPVSCTRIPDAVSLWSSTGHVVALALSHDSGTVLLADSEFTLHALDIRDGGENYAVLLYPSPVRCLAVSPSGGPAACGHADGTVSFVRLGDTGTPRVLAGNTSPVRSLAFTAGGDACLIVYDQGAPALADPVSGTKILSFENGKAPVLCSTGPAGEGWFAAAGSDHLVRCFTISASMPIATIPLYSRSITCCSAVQGGNHLVLGFHDGTIRVIGMPEGRLIREFKGHKKAITACEVTRDGNRLATVSWDGTLKVWELPGGRLVRTYDSHAGSIAALVGPAGMLLAAVTSDGIARVLDGTDGQRVRSIDLYTPEVRAAVMSYDGIFLACAGADATLRLWNLRYGSLVATGGPLATSQRCCALLHDNSALVTGGWDGSLRIFRIPDLSHVQTLTGHTSTVTCLALSRDDSLIVTGSNDTTIRLWKYGDDEAYAVIGGSRTEIGAVAVSPDETFFATGSSDGVIRLICLPYGTGAVTIEGLPGKVTALAFTRDNCNVVAGYDTGLCAWFSCAGRCLIRTVPAHSGAVTGIMVLPDDRTWVTTGEDGLCRFHSLPSLPFPALEVPGDVTVAGCLSTTGSDAAQWAFLHALLAARFQGEIGICQLPEIHGCYDIQIVG